MAMNAGDCARKPELTICDWALAYAGVGLRVLPIHTIRNGICSCKGAKGCKPGKHPIATLVPRGCLDATTDESTIKGWLSRNPDANIAIATGKESNLVVLDIDGTEGEARLAALEREHGQLPMTVEVRTGKGRHLHFSYPNSASRIKSVARNNLDIRADGGYVIVPPSRHKNGRNYTFAPTDVQKRAECPEWLVAYANGELRISAQAPPISDASSPALKARSRLATMVTNKSPSPAHGETEEARLQSALAYIPATERVTWRDVGAGIHSLNWGERGFQIWDVWSRSTPEVYDESDQLKTWRSFSRPYSGHRITVATIYYLAKQHGWVEQIRDYRTDLGNARRLVRRHGQNIRFIHEWRKWIVWTGNRWRVDEDGAIVRLAKETVESMYPEAAQLTEEQDRSNLRRHALRCQAVARIEAMIKLAQSEPQVVLSASQLNVNAWLLGVQNGVIDLETNEFRPGRRQDLITFRTGESFDPDANCPNWQDLINTITGGDKTLQAYVQRVVGYVLTGLVREEVMFVLFGSGNNGKSTFREALHKLMGDYATAADAGLLIERSSPGTATPEIARLQGRRFVAINETAENDKLNEARVKFLTSQDTITGRKLHEDFVDFCPTHKTFLTTNHKPIVRNADIGIWRRIHLLPFTVTIPQEAVEKDFLAKRLMPELAGILNWALQGLAAYRREGLNPPAIVLAATKDYREEMDVIGQWLEERCECAPSAAVPSSLAYRDYHIWGEAEIGWTFPALKFRRLLSDRGFGAKKSHGQRQIVGLRLKSAGVVSVAVVRT
jgi:putative DNA primase/helicase